ncbi:hypothetical protein AB0D12_35725 [Streptomyces sp. NPDC048479]|uniref:hypothetical protein n=1 Tax=Streptomyces sp. NPDC048479 TaxID=3154725 RepID=UPI00343FB902
MTASEAAYERGGSPGTPTMLANGEPLPEKVAGVIYEKVMTKNLLDLAEEVAGQ